MVRGQRCRPLTLQKVCENRSRPCAHAGSPVLETVPNRSWLSLRVRSPRADCASSGQKSACQGPALLEAQLCLFYVGRRDRGSGSASCVAVLGLTGQGLAGPGQEHGVPMAPCGSSTSSPAEAGGLCDYGCSETVSVNARLLCFSDFVQMLVLRGFQTNSGLRGEAEPERVPQVGEKRSAASGNWGAAGRAPVPWCHCLGASGSGGALSQGGLSRVIPEASRCARGNRQ